MINLGCEQIATEEEISDLPWMENAALIPHTTIDVVTITLLLFQIAILKNVNEYLIWAHRWYSKRAGEDIHA